MMGDIRDENIYSLGSIAGHNIAIVCLSAGCIGNSPAAVVAMQIRATFKGIGFGLMHRKHSLAIYQIGLI